LPAESWWRSTILLTRLARPRLVDRPLWRLRYRHGIPQPDPAELGPRLGIRGSAVEHLAARYPERFGVSLGNDSASVCPAATTEAADQVLRHEFDVLGSGPMQLGQAIDWHRDWKSGHRWEPMRSWTINYTNLESPSDVKIPWEVARFHWAAWLACAGRNGDAQYAAGFRDITQGWLDANPPGRGIHWANPMEVSIRAANWILAFGFFQGAPGLNESLWLRYLETLFWHGRVIRGNLEVGRRPNNHYVSNGLGLALLGLFFRDSREGREWLGTGRGILEQQIRWQVHEDGVDYEKSVSYHRLVTELFLVAFIFARRNGADFSSIYRERLNGMLDFMLAYSRDDGSTPLVSDADDSRLFRLDPARRATDHRDTLALGGAALDRDDLKAAAGRCPPEVCWLLGPDAAANWPESHPQDRSSAFPEGGYYVLRGPGTHMFLDAGPIGFDGDAGHGHNDTLSFELSAPGGVFISDSGTYCYTSDQAQHRAFASTAAHNTIQVDAAEVAEFTSLWKLRADGTRPRVIRWETGGTEEWWEAEHFGYARLEGSVIHRREVRHQVAERRWRIVDRLAGTGTHLAVLRLHLHPEVHVKVVAPNAVQLSRVGGTLRLQCSEALEVTDGWVAPRYGVKLPARVLLARRRGQLPFAITTDIAWEPV